MPGRAITTIVIHCAASVNGVSLARLGASDAFNGIGKTAAQVIDGWHKNRGFNRNVTFRRTFNPQLFHIGYHYIIDTDGTVETGRARDEVGAHAQGHNSDSLGICLVGSSKFTLEQWAALADTVTDLLKLYPTARVCGHRDLSRDLNGDGHVSRNEWTKLCPGFDVAAWGVGDMKPRQDAIMDAKR